MPAFSHLFGLHPWDVERLTFAEIHVYQSWMHEYSKQGQSEGR